VYSKIIYATEIQLIIAFNASENSTEIHTNSTEWRFKLFC